MRILLTADPELPVPPRQYGGIERLVDLWARELRVRGHAVGLVARSDSSARVDRLFPWPGRASRSRVDTFRNSFALWRAARAFQADVVHSSSRLAYTLPLLLSRRPVVMTYHRFPGPRQIRVAAAIGGRRLAFTGVSDYNTGRGSVGGGHWHTVYNCVDVAACPFAASVPADAPLVFVSRIEELKGAREAIAIARAAQVPLILAGNHSADAVAADYWQRHILPEIDGRLISYVGPVDDRQRGELLSRARALLVPVQLDEPFGLVFAEALAGGTPVISTPRGALPEIVRPGVTGFLFTTTEEGVRAVRAVGGLDRSVCRHEAETRFAPGLAVEQFLAIYAAL
jgi:glycosyltransferase involved in cell wall biosynthesis